VVISADVEEVEVVKKFDELTPFIIILPVNEGFARGAFNANAAVVAAGVMYVDAAAAGVMYVDAATFDVMYVDAATAFVR